MPLGRMKYVPNHTSMAAFLMSDRVSDVSMEAGRDVARDAQALAATYSKTGASAAAGYDVDPDVGAERAEGGIRRVAKVSTTSPGLIAQEIGTSRTPARHILERAALPYHVPRIMRERLAGGGS